MRTYYWHIHHEVIAEPTEDIEERKEYVRAVKPRNQVSIRLRLMTPVKAQDTVDKAWKEYEAIDDKAWKEYEAIDDKAWKEYEVIYKARNEYDVIDDKAYEEYEAIKDKAWKYYAAIRDKSSIDYNASLWDLHKKEHLDCPWDGKTIFPKKRSD